MQDLVEQRHLRCHLLDERLEPRVTSKILKPIRKHTDLTQYNVCERLCRHNQLAKSLSKANHRLGQGDNLRTDLLCNEVQEVLELCTIESLSPQAYCSARRSGYCKNQRL